MPSAPEHGADELAGRAFAVVFEPWHQEDHDEDAQRRGKRDQRLIAVEAPGKQAGGFPGIMKMRAGQIQRDRTKAAGCS